MRKTTKAAKMTRARLAEEIEALFLQLNANQLDDSTAERAELISDILFDMANMSGVNSTHPQLVKGYVLATYDASASLNKRERQRVREAFKEIGDLMRGCPQTRYEEIDARYHPDYEALRAAHFETKRAEEQTKLREQLEQLERLPENEAERFKLESEIYKLENNSPDDEWPEVVNG